MKLFKITLLLTLTTLLIGCGTRTSSHTMREREPQKRQEENVMESTEDVSEEPESIPEEESVYVSDGSAQGDIEAVVRNRITSQYKETDIDSVTINEDLGTDVENDYIILVNLTWNVKNTGSTSKKVLSMYSEDLAATVGKECPDVQEICIFWTVPYLDNANAKCSYERKGEGMYEMDIMWDASFQ